MARNVTKAPPRLPLFDRLLQGDSIETDRNADRAVREIRDSIRRDLEMLFNSRPRHLPFDPALEELRQSVISFGLTELQGRHVATPAQQQQLRSMIESLIHRFEPRFREVSIELIVPEGSLTRTLQLRIHAILEVDQISEPVIFDTAVDPISGGLSISSR